MAKLVPKGGEEIAYQGRMLEIVNQDMTDGKNTITFEIARRTPGIRLILVNLVNRTVSLSKEHRYEIDGDDYRLPGGKVFDTLDEYNTFLNSGNVILLPARDKAFGEAEEEVGLKLKDLKHFHTSVCGTTVKWDLFYFVSTEWAEVDQRLGTGEDISRVEVTFEDARNIALSGGMSEERSALVLLRYLSSLA
jgi:hypothetical protein